MPDHHDAVVPLSQFWRALVLVSLGFGLMLLLSWTIDANFPRQSLGAAAEVHGQLSR